MISPELARRFIERVTKYTEYNVNIMDEHGVIIASRDPDRVGQYHSIAHEILSGGPDIVETEDDPVHHIRRGINMVIQTGGKKEGVVGVTGDPEKIREAALMTKMSIETMLHYERIQEERRRRENRKEQFIYLLTQVEDASPDELRALASDLGYPEEVIRIPILIHTAGMEPDMILSAARALRLHTKLDLSISPDSHHVLIFKSLPDRKQELLEEYRTSLLEYLGDLKTSLEKLPEGKNARYFVGSFQENFRQYYHSYRHCKWLERSIPAESGDIVFFYDHMNDYMGHILPHQELRTIFHVVEKRFPDKMKPMLIETILTLNRCNFNFPQAAKALYIHKNTLSYRCRQIRTATGLDPVGNGADRMLLVSFCYYLKQKTGQNYLQS